MGNIGFVFPSNDRALAMPSGSEGARLKLSSLFFAPHICADPEGGLKNLIRGLLPRAAVIDGLGIEVDRSTSPDPVHDLIKAIELKHKSQIGLDWKSRLETGALITRLSQDSLGLDQTNNSDRIAYLKSIAKPGDVIFVTGGGKKQGILAEFIDIATRIVSSRDPSQLSFPFTHAMINIGGN